MKTIEERAVEYEEVTGCYGCELAQVKKAFIDGAESERALLTKWQCPKVSPQHEDDVLAKCEDGRYLIVHYDFRRGSWVNALTCRYTVITAWREIHE